MHSISWKGNKTAKDFSICYQRFAGTTWEEWCKMIKKETPPHHTYLWRKYELEDWYMFPKLN